MRCHRQVRRTFFCKVVNVNEKPLVSIVIPAYSSRFFAMALQSALGQTYDALEVLVCDDSESEEIEAIVNALDDEPRVRYVRNARHLGFVGNLLRAVELARGELVKVLCDDDRQIGRAHV